MKITLSLILFLVVAAMATSLYFLVSNKAESKRLVHSLTLRVGLSVGLFLLLLIAWQFGLIQPHGIRPTN